MRTILASLAILLLLAAPIAFVLWADRRVKRDLEEIEGEPMEFPDPPPPRRTPDQLRQVLQADVWDLARTCGQEPPRT